MNKLSKNKLYNLYCFIAIFKFTDERLIFQSQDYIFEKLDKLIGVSPKNDFVYKSNVKNKLELQIGNNKFDNLNDDFINYTIKNLFPFYYKDPKFFNVLSFLIRVELSTNIEDIFKLFENYFNGTVQDISNSDYYKHGGVHQKIITFIENILNTRKFKLITL